METLEQRMTKASGVELDSLIKLYTKLLKEAKEDLEGQLLHDARKCAMLEFEKRGVNYV